MRKYVSGLIPLLLVGVSYSAMAQTPLDAGALQQQLEKERKATFPSQKKLTLPDSESAAKKPSSAGNIEVTVRQFHYDGNTLLTNEELNTAVASYLNKPVTFSQLQDAATAVGDAYRAKGWVVRTFLPQQDVVDGIITIKIIEAKFGKTLKEGDLGVKIPDGRVEDMVSARQEAGQPLNTNKLNRSLLLIDDLPGISASGRLQPGGDSGETDIVIKQAPEAFINGAVMADNEGSRSTGDKRVHAFAQIMNPLWVGDQLSFYLLGSEGLDFARMEQSFPLGYDGLRIGYNASYMGYSLVPHEFDSLNADGKSSTFGLQANYPIIRHKQKNLYLNANYDHKYFKNNSQGVTSSNYQMDNVLTSLNGNYIDELLGGGSNNATIGLTVGKLDIGELDTGENAELDGGFSKLSYNVSRLQSVINNVSLYGAFSGQYSNERRLDSSEMFYLGGPSGVRAYPVSEGGGVNGSMLTAEVRWSFWPSYQLTGFYDRGYVHNSGSIKSYKLDGFGLALDWQSESGFAVSASWAYRIGDNPNPTATGKDQDGSLTENRLWLKISKRF